MVAMTVRSDTMILMVRHLCDRHNTHKIIVQPGGGRTSLIQVGLRTFARRWFQKLLTSEPQGKIDARWVYSKPPGQGVNRRFQEREGHLSVVNSRVCLTICSAGKSPYRDSRNQGGGVFRVRKAATAY